MKPYRVEKKVGDEWVLASTHSTEGSAMQMQKELKAARAIAPSRVPPTRVVRRRVVFEIVDGGDGDE